MPRNHKKRLTIVGGTYRESCMRPPWNSLFGSGLRAALALKKMNDVEVVLHTRCMGADEDGVKKRLGAPSLENRFPRPYPIRFDYVHPLSVPLVTPRVDAIEREDLDVEGDAVLAYGMLDANIRVSANRVVYDPQSPATPRPFSEVGEARELAIVLNRREAIKMSGDSELNSAALSILRKNNAQVLIIKHGLRGADVFWSDKHKHVPAYRSTRAFPIGSGDMFTASFAYFHLVRELDPPESADMASRAVAKFSEAQGFLGVNLDDRTHEPFRFIEGSVYVAAPFFTVSEEWLVREIYRELNQLGLQVNSPLHLIGRGKATDVAQKDLELLRKSDRVFAVLDNFDAGTNYELGWALRDGIPIVALYSPALQDPDDGTTAKREVGEYDDRLKMVYGNGAQLFDDLASAIDAVCGVSKTAV